MTDAHHDHTQKRKYALGLALILSLVASLSSFYHGDDAGLTVLKALVSLVFAAGFLGLPSLFGPQGADAPLSPAFILRHGALGLLVVIWVLMVLWTPGQHPVALLIAVTLGTALYVFTQAMIALANRSLARRQ